MASKRCIPTNFYEDPQIEALDLAASAVLIALIIHADDEGRNFAQASLIARWVGRGLTAEQAEACLQQIAEQDLAVLYQVGKVRYYSLTRWREWQSSLGGRITPSKHPAPPRETPGATPPAHAQESSSAPVSSERPEAPQQGCGEIPEHFREIPEHFRESSSQLNVTKLNVTQLNVDVGGSSSQASNVIPFPATRGGDGDDRETKDETIAETTRAVARILKVSVTEALTRVVTEFLAVPSVSLLAEADAAREWIDDPRRNKKRRQMSPAFFRSWLRRERGDYTPAGVPAPAPAQTGTATGTTGPASTSPATGADRPRAAPAGPAYRSLMNLGAEYEAQRRAARRKTPLTEKPINSE